MFGVASIGQLRSPRCTQHASDFLCHLAQHCYLHILTGCDISFYPDRKECGVKDLRVVW